MTIDRNAFAGIEAYLREIYIKEPLLKSLPKHSIDFLRELEVFSVENSQVIRLPRLSGLRRLKLFKMDGSFVRDLPSDVLRNLPELKYLHITNSELKRIDTGILENLNKLQLANFTNNHISWIHSRAFRYAFALFRKKGSFPFCQTFP